MAPAHIFAFNIIKDKRLNPAQQWQKKRLLRRNCLQRNLLDHHHCVIISYQHHLGIVGILLLQEADFLRSPFRALWSYCVNYVGGIQRSISSLIAEI